MVNSDPKKQELHDEVNYLIDTLKVIGAYGERVKVSISLEITDSETKEKQTREKEFYLIEEPDGWKLDSYTYARYQSTTK